MLWHTIRTFVSIAALLAVTIGAVPAAGAYRVAKPEVGATLPSGATTRAS